VKKIKHKKLFIFLALVIIYAISLILPLVSPFTKYPIYLIYCERRPVVGSNFAAGYDYILPSDRQYHIDPFTNKYWCNEKQAIADGHYHHLGTAKPKQ